MPARFCTSVDMAETAVKFYLGVNTYCDMKSSLRLIIHHCLTFT